MFLFHFSHVPVGYENLETIQEEMLGGSGQKISLLTPFYVL